ncbi:unnamed protein product [Alternaria alternata]
MSSASSGAEGPQTPEDVARDQPEPEIDELGRVRVANKYATIITSRQAYGQLLSPGQRSRMELWVERLPYDWHFEDANTACLIAVTVYKDWLDWSESKAFSWLDKLTKFERRFRIAGVAYHKIPYEDIFAPLKDMVTRLIELRIKVQHVPSAATAGELMVAFWHDLAPPTDALITEFETFKQYISKLQSDAYTLRLFNKKYFQVNDLGVHNAWYDPVVDMINNKRTPTRGAARPGGPSWA